MVFEKVNFPKDLNSLSVEELELLSTEIRQTIIDTVSKVGGHFAPNLGTVELTVALHYCLDSPRDRIVWDVGHQAYTHKLLTGRKDKFHTIRQLNGLSGFPKQSESEHDAFDVGHSSTSISAGLGIAEARNQKGEDYHVVSIIGDGAMTAGLAFEGLNQAGFLGTKFIVVLNDNNMSIASNVGAMNKYTNRLMNKIVSTPLFTQVRNDVHHLLDNVKDEELLESVKRLRLNALKVATEGIIFQEMGFTYIGPIDGHNIKELIPAIEKAKSINGPVLLHIKTVKGKGYSFAEETPQNYHGVGPFDIATGKSLKKKSGVSYSAVFSGAAIDLAEMDDRVVAITAAMPAGTGLKAFKKEFPKRFYDVGIAEQHAVTFAAGLAANGLRPIVAVYSSFMQRAFDSVVHDVCMPNLPVTLAMDRAGLVGADGQTHHGVFDLSFMRIPPELVLMAPQDGRELRNMMFTALKREAPVAVRYPRGTVPDSIEGHEMKELEIGKAKIVADYGNDVAIFAIGNRVSEAVAAAETLKQQGINVTVVNARFVKPLDSKLLCEIARSIGKVVTVEDNAVVAGFGSAVLECLNDNDVDARVHCIGVRDEFVEQGTQPELWQACGIDGNCISGAVKGLLK